MKKYVILICALLVTTLAVAASINFSWTNATQNTDGSDIPITGEGSIANTVVEYGVCNAAKDGISGTPLTVTVPGTATVATATALPPGVWCGRASHINTYGVRSDPSGIVVVNVNPPKPKPPSNFTFG